MHKKCIFQSTAKTKKDDDPQKNGNQSLEDENDDRSLNSNTFPDEKLIREDSSDQLHFAS